MNKVLFNWFFSGGLRNNLISYFRFESNVNDSVGSNTMTATGSPTYTSGKVGSCIVLDGVTQYIEKSSPVGLTFTNGVDTPFSISCWVNTVKTASQFIIGKRDGAATLCEYQIFIDGSNKVSCSIFSGGTTSNFINILSSSALSSSTWYHIVLTYDASAVVGGMKLYINGSLATVTPTTTGTYTGMTNTGAHVTIGAASWDHSLKWQGNIDEFGIWGRVLNTADISRLYNGGSGLAYPF